jgi:hypothetical protein
VADCLSAGSSAHAAFGFFSTIVNLTCALAAAIGRIGNSQNYRGDRRAHAGSPSLESGWSG